MMKPFLSHLSAEFVVHDLLEATNPAALIEQHGPSIRGIAGGGVDAKLIDKLPALEIIANFGVGYDSIDVPAARARNISVSYTPDVLNSAVAEQTIGMMVAQARNLIAADRYVRDGKWPMAGYPLQRELTGARAGIVGLGRIGKEIARRCEAMGMQVAYFGRNRQADQSYAFYADIVELAAWADWLIVVAPGGRETDGIVSREVLTALGPEGVLVNMARGSLVDESALVELLGTGGLGGAALDVFVKEPLVPDALLRMENVVLSPHQGSATIQTRHAMGALVVENLLAHFSGRPLVTPIPD